MQLPPLPAPAPAQAAAPEDAARELAARVLAGGNAALPALLAALQASGIAVADADRSVLVPAAAPAQGWAIQQWEALALGLESSAQPLITLPALIDALARDVPLSPAADPGSRLLQDIRALARSDNPTRRFFGHFVVELGRQGPQPQDLLGDIVPADVSLGTVQVELLLRRVVADLKVLSRKLAGPTRSSSKGLSSAPLPPAASVSHGPCQLSDTESMILDVAALGVTYMFDNTMEYLIEHAGLHGLEGASKAIGVANVLLAWLEVYLYYSNLKVDLHLEGDPPLVRTKTTRAGELRKLGADVSFDMGNKQLVNCFRIMLNMAGMDLSGPTSGAVANSRTQWILLEGGSPDSSKRIVQFAGDPVHGLTDDKGHAEIGIEGAAQKRDLSPSARPLMKKAVVRFLVAPKGPSFSQDLYDAVNGAASGPAGLVGTVPAEIMMRTTLFKPFDIDLEVKDWAEAWTGSIVFSQTGHGDRNTEPAPGQSVVWTGDVNRTAEMIVTDVILELPPTGIPGMPQETFIQLKSATTLTGYQQYTRHEHRPPECDMEGGCNPPPPPYDDMYVETLSGKQNVETYQFVRLRPDGSYAIEVDFETAPMTGNWSSSWSGDGGELESGPTQIHLRLEVSGGEPDATVLKGTHSETELLTLLPSSHSSGGEVVVPTAVTVTWDLHR